MAVGSITVTTHEPSAGFVGRLYGAFWHKARWRAHNAAMSLPVHGY